MVKSAAERRSSRLFVAEGLRLCYDAAISGVRPRRSFITAEAAARWPAETGAIARAAKENYEIPPSVAEKLADTKTTQGVFILCDMPEGGFSMREDGLYVVLAGLQDPGNIGTILRTCEAMASAGVFVCGAADLWSPKVLRASMGSLFRVPVSVTEEATAALKALREAGCETWAAALDREAVQLPDARFGKRAAIVIGNEGAGLPPEVIAACDRTVFIPMPGRAESLNAAAAAAILIYSAGRAAADGRERTL